MIDVAVIGAGPAGLEAARVAGRAGARVVVVDDGPAPGGQIWRRDARTGVHPRADALDADLRSMKVTRLFRCAVISIARHGPGFVLALDGASPIVTRALVFATGARELFLPFPGWTLPGVVGIGGLQALVRSGMDVRGRAVVIAGSGPLLLPVASSVAAAGADVLVVAEQAGAGAVARFVGALVRHPAQIAAAVRYRAGFARTRYRTGHWIVRAESTAALRARARSTRATLTDGVRERAYDCDLLAVAFGLVPNLELPAMAGCALADDRVIVDAAMMTSVPGIFAAGETCGVAGLDHALRTGAIAGASAARRAGGEESSPAGRAIVAPRDPVMAAMHRAFRLRPELARLAEADTIVCRCEDVPLGAIDPEWTERDARLHARVGMGPCQGRVCGAALRHLRGWGQDSVRAPASPVAVETLITQFASFPQSDSP